MLRISVIYKILRCFDFKHAFKVLRLVLIALKELHSQKIQILNNSSEAIASIIGAFLPLIKKVSKFEFSNSELENLAFKILMFISENNLTNPNLLISPLAIVAFNTSGRKAKITQLLIQNWDTKYPNILTMSFTQIIEDLSCANFNQLRSLAEKNLLAVNSEKNSEQISYLSIEFLIALLSKSKKKLAMAIHILTDLKFDATVIFLDDKILLNSGFMVFSLKGRIIYQLQKIKFSELRLLLFLL